MKKEVIIIILIILLLVAVFFYKKDFEKDFLEDESGFSYNQDKFYNVYFWVIGAVAFFILLFLAIALLKRYY